MIEKRILVPGRIRRPPREGFFWVDRRFFREQADHLSRDAVLLYVFLCSVSDRDGLSYWREESTAARLRVTAALVVRAREELLARDLVAHEAPLTQVLALPPSGRRAATETDVILGEVLGRLLGDRP
jgi:hypothetical protein